MISIDLTGDDRRRIEDCIKELDITYEAFTTRLTHVYEANLEDDIDWIAGMFIEDAEIAAKEASL